MQITHEQYTRIYAEVYSDLACNARVQARKYVEGLKPTEVYETVRGIDEEQARKYVEGLKPTEVYETVRGILDGLSHATDNFPQIDDYIFDQAFEDAWNRFAAPYTIEDKETREVMEDMQQRLASPAALKAYMQEAVRFACYERATGLWGNS